MVGGFVVMFCVCCLGGEDLCSCFVVVILGWVVDFCIGEDGYIYEVCFYYFFYLEYCFCGIGDWSLFYNFIVYW